ncbi:LURP-one-related/scramblase family protein [Brachybacterium sp. Z12]|uniref:LURP-one-related/scramblase family protein n=1 Tax=Brachybacterium sp. Z12 TaxID=2759167 RepID=UPI00223A8098|nr:hypothetical protein [Brachybacterium sp. Z12]
MDTPAPAPRLLDRDTLVMQQITGFMSNDFDILDGTGEQVAGHVSTTGSGVTRFFAGSRSLDVADADGTPLLHVADPPGIGFDRFELSAPDGTPLAELTSRFSIFSTRVSMTMADGAELELRGDPLGLDFTFEMQGTVAARVGRQWAGLSRGFLGHSRYVLPIEPTVPAPLRLAIIGGCIVLDLIRRKKSRNG